MINLLPPTIKQEIRFSKRNARLVGYLKLTTFLVVILAGSLFTGRWYLDQQAAAADKAVTETEAESAKYKQLQDDAKSLNSRLTAIQAIQKSQAKFSILLGDLAQTMPQGTAISSIVLTGDDKKPVKLTVKALDYKTAIGFRDNITKSKRISAADIDQIQLDQPQPGQPQFYTVTVTFSFNPGKAR